MIKIFTFDFLVSKQWNKKPVVYKSSLLKNEEISVPEHCVNNVLNFARAYRVVDSKSTGKVELVIN